MLLMGIHENRMPSKNWPNLLIRSGIQYIDIDRVSKRVHNAKAPDRLQYDYYLVPRIIIGAVCIVIDFVLSL